jgi:penicillin-binding protein 1B
MGYPNELIRDTPIVVKYGRDSEWRPRNGDRAFRGPITVRRALEASRNVPAVRLALSTGLDEVRRLGQAMGIESPLGSIPSLALGAFEATPLELATVYATLAARGERPVVHGLTGIEGCSAPASPGEPASERVLDPDTAFLVTSMLQGSLDRGTAWKARRLGVTGPLAGKTGSSDDLRDAWFAGYSPDRVTVVWVGRDENTPAGLGGADGALPVWADFVRGVSPPGGPPRFESPAGYRSVTLDPDTGLLASPSCPRRIVEHLPPSQVPWRTCVAHLPELDLVPFGVFDGTRGTSGVEAPAAGPIARILPGTPSLSRDVDPIELFRQRQKRSLGSVDGPPPTTGVDDG